MESTKKVGQRRLKRDFSVPNLNEKKCLIRVPSSKKFPVDFFKVGECPSTSNSSSSSPVVDSLEFTFMAQKMTRSVFMSSTDKLSKPIFIKKSSCNA